MLPAVTRARSGWLLLIHQVPHSPPYLRVKVWRRLGKIGAVAVKNAVYALPVSDQALEDFQWIGKEIQQGGGEASVCEASFVDGLTDDGVIALFRAARDADYGQILGELREARRKARPSGTDPPELGRLRRWLAETVAIDFFDAPGRVECEDLLAEIEKVLRGPSTRKSKSGAGYSGRTWVTRQDVHIDRVASAWLIRRFVDRQVKFKFVPPRGYRPEAGEIRFDMFDAEFTHEGDRCTFEVLAARFCPRDRAVQAIAEIVHDIDLKETRFERVETAGVALVIESVCAAGRQDLERIERVSAVLDDLYAAYQKKGAS
jgi:hypothetical protein